ncbi:formate/nitrite transporter family protein [Sphingomonas oryzagri]|uniref:Formate/nitrite transporter family protein n=1 Tax=Sphingomonas oryzagri TaxID=3042314 RepID=A0ABT6N2R7_9SPHN|nr:formate/nitrite transporter family protein [Sphingomonas oryzagri]MDH7639362.1 formate/nitrite transporter family protein [Sphingomonas oryzagri]
MDTDEREAQQKPAEGLSDEEVESVAERRAGSAKVVHEVVRLQGDEELDRPALSLLFSGFAAGVAISASVLAETFLTMGLPNAPWTKLVASFGYCVGFVIVVMGNLQLFTENTVTAVLPVATHPTLHNVWRLLRLWLIVLVSNLAGTMLVAALIASGTIVAPEARQAAIELSLAVNRHDALTTLALGTPAGFLVAAIAWILPNARGSEFRVIVMVTYVIAIGGFSHVVAGSAEAWLIVFTGRDSALQAINGFILPALVGNIIGGTGLFAVLARMDKSGARSSLAHEAVGLQLDCGAPISRTRAVTAGSRCWEEGTG